MSQRRFQQACPFGCMASGRWRAVRTTEFPHMAWWSPPGTSKYSSGQPSVGRMYVICPRSSIWSLTTCHHRTYGRPNGQRVARARGKIPPRGAHTTTYGGVGGSKEQQHCSIDFRLPSSANRMTGECHRRGASPKASSMKSSGLASFPPQKAGWPESPSNASPSLLLLSDFLPDANQAVRSKNRRAFQSRYKSAFSPRELNGGGGN
ncbi:hypothetical protein C8Q73DRAFT_259003 [Cubamyces lactineus]|nr:hypothetical protein C8Q73DRAFT_259003 [Cubamyces lactineus]